MVMNCPHRAAIVEPFTGKGGRHVRDMVGSQFVRQYNRKFSFSMYGKVHPQLKFSLAVHILPGQCHMYEVFFVECCWLT